MDINDVAAIVYAPNRWRMLKYVKAELQDRIATIEAAGADSSYLRVRLKDVERRLANGELIDSPF